MKIIIEIINDEWENKINKQDIEMRYVNKNMERIGLFFTDNYQVYKNKGIEAIYIIEG